MTNEEKIIEQIIDLESSLYDQWNFNLPPEDRKRLKDLYEELGYFLTDEQKEIAIKKRKERMSEHTGMLSEDFLNKTFNNVD